MWLTRTSSLLRNGPDLEPKADWGILTLSLSMGWVLILEFYWNKVDSEIRPEFEFYLVIFELCSRHCRGHWAQKQVTSLRIQKLRAERQTRKQEVSFVSTVEGKACSLFLTKL